MLLLVVVILGSFTVHDAAAHAVPGGAHLHRVPHRGRRAARRRSRGTRAAGGGLERVLLALSLLDRPAGGEVAAVPRRAAAASRRGRSAFSRKRWRRCVRLPSVAGVRWRAGGGERRAGRAQRRTRSTTRRAELELTIYSRYRLGPALHWHLHLLGQLLGEFYVAKLREEKLRQASYLQAVHETGARMTHDIKNLLQSLIVLTSVAARDEATRTRRSCRRWCAASCRSIERRLADTLEKLQRPQAARRDLCRGARLVGGARAPVPRRGRRVRSRPRRRRGARLPRSLFDSVADNLIRNALAKRAARRRPCACASRSTAASASRCASATAARRCRPRSPPACCARRSARAAAWASACTRPRARPSRAATGWSSKTTATARSALLLTQGSTPAATILP